MATRSKVHEAARAQTTRSGRVPQSAIDAELQAFDDKDLRLRSVGKDVRKREAKRRLMDIDIKAGQPGTNLCRFTGKASAEKQRGKRPYFYKEKNVGRVGVDLCAKAVEAAWKDPEFLAEQRRICGDDTEYVFPYKRKSGTVKGHCRNLHAPRPRARKARPDPRVKELEKLIQKRANLDANDVQGNISLSAQIRKLRAELKPPAPPPAPTPTPPTDDPPPLPDEPVGDTEAPSTVPPPDDTNAPDPSPFTGAPGTGFDGTASTVSAQSKPKFNQRVYAYIESLPRGERDKAKRALRTYVYGPGKMQPDAAIKRYKERRVRDAQAPIGSTDFDELDASDSDADESDDDIDNLRGAGDGTRSDVGALSDALFPMEVTENTLPDDRSTPTLHQDMVMRQSEQQAQARARAEQQRARDEWEAVMAASRATQRDGSVDFSGTTEPFPDHDQVIAGAGLSVSGSGLLSYPGEGLIRDGLSDLAGAIHNI